MEHNKEIIVANPAALRKKIEQEIQKQDKKFQVKAIIKDCRSLNRLRILCRNEEELKKVKSATMITAAEGAHVLRDQLYPVKVNNARADALLMPDGTLKANTALEIATEN